MNNHIVRKQLLCVRTTTSSDCNSHAGQNIWKGEGETEDKHTARHCQTCLRKREKKKKKKKKNKEEEEEVEEEEGGGVCRHTATQAVILISSPHI